jgi:lysylphosphatidylglycerol synthetase-like protein (DUF2156 family)
MTDAAGEVVSPPGRMPRFGRLLDEGEPVPADAYVVGEQPWWDLARWEETLLRTPSLRAQLRRAFRHGVRVREPAASELQPGAPLRAELSRLVWAWLRGRRMAPLHFAAAVVPFSHLERRRVFVAEVAGRPCAALFALPDAAGSEWTVDHLVRAGRVPNGTTEALVDTAFRAARTSGARRATLGLCALSGRVPWALRWARQAFRPLYDFEGLLAFRARLHPHAWQRVLVEHPGQHAVAGTVRALRAFAGGSLTGFAWETALHLLRRER